MNFGFERFVDSNSSRERRCVFREVLREASQRNQRFGGVRNKLGGFEAKFCKAGVSRLVIYQVDYNDVPCNSSSLSGTFASGAVAFSGKL
jgi:hypothetical protein